MDTLYTLHMLTLALEKNRKGTLSRYTIRHTEKTKRCGSLIHVDLLLDKANTVMDYAYTIQACLVGQSSAALFSSFVVGLTRAELACAAEVLSKALKGLIPWDENRVLLHYLPLEHITPMKERHEAVLLPFVAVLNGTKNYVA